MDHPIDRMHDLVSEQEGYSEPISSIDMSAADKKAIGELDYVVRSRCPFIFIESIEEEKLILRLRHYCDAKYKKLVAWDCATGPSLMVTQKSGGTIDIIQALSDPSVFLDWISEDSDLPESETGGGAIYVMKDLHNWLQWAKSGNSSQMDETEKLLVRQLRSMADGLRAAKKTVILLAPERAVPQDMREMFRVIQWPLPTFDEIRKKLDELITQLGVLVATLDEDAEKGLPDFSPEVRDEMARAFSGMTMTRIMQVFKENSVQSVKMSPEEHIEKIIRAKRAIIDNSDCGLNFIPMEQLPDVDEIGGLQTLKEYLFRRRRHFSAEARDYGLPHLKGILLIGVQGCGKSMAAKAVAKMWRLPLLRFDMGAVFGSLVGSSEGKMRQAIQYLEAMAPCVVWLDEIEKSTAGIGSSDRTDSGTTARVISSLLTWMNDKTAPVYIVATANQVSSLPPELIRAGRFDERFFVDLPTEQERQEIVSAHLVKRRDIIDDFDVNEIAKEMGNFSGAEIEGCIIEAMTNAFDAGREFTTQDIIEASYEMFPLAETMPEVISSLQAWAKDHCRPASGKLSINDRLQRRKQAAIQLSTTGELGELGELAGNDNNGDLDGIELTPINKDNAEGPDLG